MSANNNDLAALVASDSLLGRYVSKPLAHWWARRRAMDELMSLNDHMLKDIGIARCEIPGIVAGKIVPRRAANDNLPERSRTVRRK